MAEADRARFRVALFHGGGASAAYFAIPGFRYVLAGFEAQKFAKACQISRSVE